jgi:hypothetical protein
VTTFAAITWGAVAVYVGLWALEKIIRTARLVVGCVLLVAAVSATLTGCGAVQVEPAGTTAAVAAPLEAQRRAGTTVALAQLHVDDRPETARTGGLPYRSEEWAFTDAWPQPGNGCRDDLDAKLRAARRVDTRADACRTLTGLWVSLYDGAEHARADELDVDHLVARKDAFTSGAASWPAPRRAEFVGYPENLQPVTSRVNSAKGDRGPDAWPFDGGRLAVKGAPTVAMAPGATCQYARIYVAVKARYQLTVTTAQRDALGRLLATCNP